MDISWVGSTGLLLLLALIIAGIVVAVIKQAFKMGVALLIIALILTLSGCNIWQPECIIHSTEMRMLSENNIAGRDVVSSTALRGDNS
jgi:hypothetical protein